MLRVIVYRLLMAVPLALGVATLVFLLVELAPGDPVDRLLGDLPVPPEVRQRIEQIHGTDQPAHQRYLHWLGRLARGDLGWSHSYSRPVSAALASAIPATLLLAAAALLLHVGAGLTLGIVSAWRRDGWADRTLTAVGLVLYSMPTFWLGLMALTFLGHHAGWFPLHGMQSSQADGWPWDWRLADRLWHLVLPASVLGIASAAAMARFVRAGLLQALAAGFVRAARARGLGRGRLLWVHALRAALLPLINLIGLSLPVLLSGSLVTEVVFGWPGMGRLTYNAIRKDDLALVLAATLLVALMVVVGNLLADLSMALADPRIRLGKRTDRS